MNSQWRQLDQLTTIKDPLLSIKPILLSDSYQQAKFPLNTVQFTQMSPSSSSASSYPLAEKVLVTGASGYIAAHIVHQLFSAGYDIVGTVRAAERGEWLAARFPGFKYEVVADLRDSAAAFDALFQKHPDIKYVLHTASPVTYNGTDFVKDMVEPAVQGAAAVLNAAHRYGRNVKKVVYTSSLAACYPMALGYKNPSVFVSEDTWNPTTLEQASANWSAGYSTSKTLTEKSVWEFQETVKPRFSIATILVPFVLGPPIHVTTYAELTTSLEFLKAMLDLPADATQFANAFAGHADVRDIARTHVVALENAAFDNGRWFPLAGLANDQVIADIIHKYRPDEAADLAIGTPGDFKPEEYYKYDNSKTVKNLGFDFIPFTKTVLDQFDAFMELKKKSDL